jgi:IS5 family transposase
MHRRGQGRRQSAIEAVIGHMKTDGRFGRRRLTGRAGDAANENDPFRVR